MHILETRELTHRFGSDEKALCEVDLQVSSGSIYGFLGPNGAGKTTTLRLILGLLKRQSGSIEVFGKRFDTHRVEILRNIGAMIESPSLYGHLTAAENLEILRKVYRCPRLRIGEVLEFGGLANTGKKKASQFSLGMRQRLAIAAALLHGPALLILDEPTNGLDPGGIIEIREMLQTLHRERGTTILISSHLLSEVERLVTHVGVINKGRMLFQGTLDELKQKQQQAVSIVIETGDIPGTKKILDAIDIDWRAENGKLVMPAAPKELIADLNRRLVSAGIEVFEISIVRGDLESIFIDMIGN